jgi:hypothetical protein
MVIETQLKLLTLGCNASFAQESPVTVKKLTPALAYLI